MRIRHHDSLTDLDDAWWEEAGMLGFSSSASAYRVDPNAFAGREINEVFIHDIGQVGEQRQTIGIFRDCIDTGRTARERVLYILSGFRSGAALPPVEIARDQHGCHPYRLTHGTHRLYCSLAAGFLKIPTVEQI